MVDIPAAHGTGLSFTARTMSIGFIEKTNSFYSLAELTDKFGSRLSGSQSIENATDYMVEKLAEVGLENVHTENATLPH